MMSFGARLAEAFTSYGHLCVGIDPHPAILDDWGLAQDASGLRECGMRVVEAAAGRVGVVKPQVAFFERYGVAGLQALSEVIAAAKQAGLLVIADAKRGDIGSTMEAYAEAWLNPVRDFAVDALTVSPFLGFESLEPAVRLSERYGTGLFVLALTSNPEGQQVQLAHGDNKETVAGSIVRAVAASNAAAAEPAPLGSIGLVVGATTAHLAEDNGIDLVAGKPPILAPGYGAQGASAASIQSSFATAWDQVLVNSSRAVLSAGPTVAGIVSHIEQSCADLE
ncbi:orotidine-5'-phosphate decarboxylase [Nesterenkonia salmonea]|uniref:Orotidine-5'-phosphate decarboxylase n=1 Tax=Nesterenkonia salmonea TaxID=1804987 RepID=A0A5R9BGT0_9MICC|nr:orotidine-5'-phosphate decarboxylase [Nesterenkonia salmonea]TLP99120.1 orotidine-5'-phosphate decarboxylase [Nesterenkonia salmonea]